MVGAHLVVGCVSGVTGSMQDKSAAWPSEGARSAACSASLSLPSDGWLNSLFHKNFSILADMPAMALAGASSGRLQARKRRDETAKNSCKL
jgi:hypothetical protein